MAPTMVEPRPTMMVNEGGLTHRSKARGLLHTANLPALQNLLKREPEAYKDEFVAQWNHYQSLRRIYAAEIGADAGAGSVGHGAKSGGENAGKFEQLLGFVTQLAPSYPDLTASFPQDLADLLLQHHAALTPDVRRACVRCLVLLRNRDVLSSEDLLRTLFPLLTLTTSSALRTSMQKTILSDLKTANAKHKHHRLNRVVQGLLFSMVERGMDGQVGFKGGKGGKGAGAPKGKSEALWAVRLTADLWKRGIWTDAKTVSLVALACFHPHPKVQSTAVRFFLGDLHSAEDEGSDGSSDEDNIPDVEKLKHQRKINKKSKKNDRQVRDAAKVARKKRKAKEAAGAAGSANFPALYLLHDPQSFGEKLFENLSRHDKAHSLEQKVLLMQLLSRVMGAHKLCVLSFYSYVVKYLSHHQKLITLILVSLAQSVHDQTPPDVLSPVVRKLSDAFVHPGVGFEVVAAGLNAIREVCRRQPWCMDATLLEDLIEYRKSKDKGVTAAARGLLQLYREVNPELLRRKERGKAATMGLSEGTQARPFGQPSDTVQGIEGLELLEAHLEEEAAAKAAGAAGDGVADEGDGEDADAGWEGWELESDGDSDDSGGWISVSSGSDNESAFEISDSEDENDHKNGKKGDAARKACRALERKVKKTGDAASLAGEEESADENQMEEDGVVKGESVGPEAKEAGEIAEQAQKEEQKISTLAMTKILTPADFAKLNELRLAAAEAAAKEGGGAAAKRRLASLRAAQKRSAPSSREADPAFLDEADILGPRKRQKDNYEERLASIAKGREDREKFGSSKGKKKKETPSSSTNKEKAKGKNFKMIARSFNVRNKKNASLKEKSKRLRNHIDNAKKKK